MEWASELIKKINMDLGHIDGLSYSIFYSPPKSNPTLLVIGDNPGGKQENLKQIELPTVHEYFVDSYLLANKMKSLIFAGNELQDILKESVKTNRIFIKSANLNLLQNLPNGIDPQKYCEPYITTIIKEVQPKYIFAESFGAFNYLSPNESKIILEKESSKKPLLLKGTYNNIPVLGINHPSMAHLSGITNLDWNLVNAKLYNILIQEKPFEYRSL